MQVARNAPSNPSSPEGPVRRHPRVLFSVPIRLHHLMPGGVRSTHGISLDIGEGGMGALVEGRLEVGDTVEIEVKLPDFDLTTVAIVRHSSTLRSGFEFLGLTQEERLQIAGLVGHS